MLKVFICLFWKKLQSVDFLPCSVTSQTARPAMSEMTSQVEIICSLRFIKLVSLHTYTYEQASDNDVSPNIVVKWYFQTKLPLCFAKWTWRCLVWLAAKSVQCSVDHNTCVLVTAAYYTTLHFNTLLHQNEQLTTWAFSNCSSLQQNEHRAKIHCWFLPLGGDGSSEKSF